MSHVLLLGIPLHHEVRPHDDLTALVADAIRAAGEELRDGDIVVVSSKVVSKALGLMRPSAERDQAVAEATLRVVAERRTPVGTTRVVQSVAGPVMAAAGVDASNTGGDVVLSLPADPDACARQLRADLGRLWQDRYGAQPRIGVVITDTAGRSWRDGQVDLAIGAAGLHVLEDLAGRPDDDGRTLSVTRRALADEIASAADLVKGKTHRIPLALVRGVEQLVSDDAAPGARSLVRTGASDWFALGSAEAVRAALGCPPGTPRAEVVGVPSIGGEPRLVRTERALRLAGPPPGALDVTDTDTHVDVTLKSPDTSYAAGVAVGRWLARYEVALASEGLAMSELDSTGPQVHAVRVSRRDADGTTLAP